MGKENKTYWFTITYNKGGQTYYMECQWATIDSSLHYVGLTSNLHDCQLLFHHAIMICNNTDI